MCLASGTWVIHNAQEEEEQKIKRPLKALTVMIDGHMSGWVHGPEQEPAVVGVYVIPAGKTRCVVIVHLMKSKSDNNYLFQIQNETLCPDHILLDNRESSLK